MVARSTLRTRLEYRLGVSTSSTLQTNLMNEAINSALGRRLSDGAPGLAFSTIAAPTLGDVAVARAAGAMTQAKDGDLILCDTDDTGIRKNDILDVDGDKYLIRRVVSTGVHIGHVIEANATYTTITCTRRTIRLANTGRVISVRLQDGNNLTYDPLAGHKHEADTGTPKRFTQSENFVSIWPAPSSADRFIITQADLPGDLSSDSDVVDLSAEAQDAVIESARFIFLTWTGGLDQISATTGQASLSDAKDELQEAGPGVFVKGSR